MKYMIETSALDEPNTYYYNGDIHIAIDIGINFYVGLTDKCLPDVCISPKIITNYTRLNG